MLLPALLAFTQGCANPGNPRPPSLRLPALATHVEARRVGDTVSVSWETPARTTEGDTIRGAVTASVCRTVAASPGKTACVPVKRVPAKAGRGEVNIDLEPEFRTGTPRLLQYSVELLNEHERSAGLSAPALAAAGDAPAYVSQLTLVARPEGALVTWSPVPGTDLMQIERTDSGAAARQSATRKLPGSNPLAADATPGTVLLRPKADAAAGDPGGLLDRDARLPHQPGISYIYIAQRVRMVQIAGHLMEVRGAASAPVSFTYVDQFVPAAPSGLVAIPSLRPAAIDLSWEPGAEPELTGYNVYRREGAGAAVLLTAKPVAVAAWADRTAVPGHVYFYRVTAVRRETLESPPSPEVSETIQP